MLLQAALPGRNRQRGGSSGFARSGAPHSTGFFGSRKTPHSCLLRCAPRSARLDASKSAEGGAVCAYHCARASEKRQGIKMAVYRWLFSAVEGAAVLARSYFAVNQTPITAAGLVAAYLYYSNFCPAREAPLTPHEVRQVLNVADCWWDHYYDHDRY